MKVFVGYGYNPNDLWIEELVFPLIKCFNGTIVTGKDIGSEELHEEIKKRIDGSDMVLAFFTRREEFKNGKFSTHPWVIKEWAWANYKRISVVEIRDAVVSSSGLSNTYGRIDFELDDKATLLVKLANELSKHQVTFQAKSKPKQLLMLPKEIVDDFREYIDTDDLKCFCEVKVGATGERQERPAKIDKTGKSLCVYIYDFPNEGSVYINLKIRCYQLEWKTDGFIPVATYSKLIKK